MLQNVSISRNPGHAPSSMLSSGEGMIIPAIDADGRISVPGFAYGLSVETYLPLVHLYTRILEASRILDRYRAKLRFCATGCNAGQDQSPLTSLQPSRLTPHLAYKREDQTATRAYKVRGALVAMAKAMDNRQSDHFIGVSTGNHALGMLKAAELLQPASVRTISVRIVAPSNTAPWKLEKLQHAFTRLNEQGVQGELLLRGDTFDEARAWVLEHQNTNETYIDPYSDPWVVAGQGTLGLELVHQCLSLLSEHLYEAVTIIAPVGGGGLLTGTAAAFKMASAWEPRLRKVNAQFVGMRLADLDAPLGDAIRVAEVAASNTAMLAAMHVPMVAMTNEDMAQGVAFVQHDLNEKVEGASGGAVFPALPGGTCQPSEKHLVISVLSGANI